MTDYNQIILNEKINLNNLLSDFLNQYNEELEDNKIQKIINEIISQYSTLLTKLNKCISDCHQKNDFFYSSDLRNDFKATINDYLKISFKFLDIIESLIKKHNLVQYVFPNQAFYVIQKFMNTFCSKLDKQDLEKEFSKRNIDTNGFNLKFKKVKNKLLKIQLWIGIPLLLLTTILIFGGESFLGTKFNGIQLTLLKAFISLSISIVGSSLIEGKVETKWTISQGISVRAIGWIAIFLLLYYFNPSNPGEVF